VSTASRASTSRGTCSLSPSNRPAWRGRIGSDLLDASRHRTVPRKATVTCLPRVGMGSRPRSPVPTTRWRPRRRPRRPWHGGLARRDGAAGADGPAHRRRGRRDGNYFGSAVNVAARIMAAGHGGQVLVSAVTAGLVGSTGLSNLGEHTFAGLDAPERASPSGGRWRSWTTVSTSSWRRGLGRPTAGRWGPCAGAGD
jgi:hypothetical protein